MWFIGLIAILYTLQQNVNCFLFDNDNETQALNRDCRKENDLAQEGNIGQSPWFPWLGILRVHIHTRGSFQIALTGIVLIKPKYALGNANDLARIPRKTLKDDSRAMFVTGQNVAWYCNVTDFMSHPEFKVTTLNTVGIVELNYEDSPQAPKPICWPSKNYNTTNQLYLFGYTDENELLEKTVIQLQYVDKSLCVEYYERAKVGKTAFQNPTNYLCAFGRNSKAECVWENGRVVASNATGSWVLIGLLVDGPGCTAPARFLDTTSYMPWIMSALTLNEDYEDEHVGKPPEDFDIAD